MFFDVEILIHLIQYMHRHQSCILELI